ncbi:glycerophosphodiester phosphodiesterase family protein [Lactococcus lactis]|uniref:glycerophosphodiester phosphodiesterase family protein n=1 Tax=Lactococcus lactis TaxID=1358 RepID=UPI0011425704|nr:glycerophosphodiester phosphodiesterase family protein [Lactococcus lactis]UPG98070.1 glycerophosphodiester phosphodiesterase [Lactococcus lactis]GEB07912.1 hypothetical protein LLA03_04970 [Lactococcus lactis subsp. lactis]
MTEKKMKQGLKKWETGKIWLYSSVILAGILVGIGSAGRASAEDLGSQKDQEDSSNISLSLVQESKLNDEADSTLKTNSSTDQISNDEKINQDNSFDHGNSETGQDVKVPESNSMDNKEQNSTSYTTYDSNLTQDSKILESQTKQETNNISETEKKPEVEYTTQVQNIGWQDPVSNGQSAGTVGQSLRLEAIKVNLNNIDKNKGGINYQTYCQNIGWQGGVSNGDVAGTVGKSLRLEAIRIGLSGDIAKLYNVYYRVQVQNFGWLGWATNGATAGTSHLSLRLESLQIQLVKLGDTFVLDDVPAYIAEPGITYQVQIQNIGWQDVKRSGGIAGTQGKALRIEALKINIGNNGEDQSNAVQYASQVQNIGWQAPVSNGQISGTVGQSLRDETLQVSLAGNLSRYFNVYYQTYCQNIGWLDWARNGDIAGTARLGYRLESLRIIVEPKWVSAPGVSTNAFINSTLKYTLLQHRGNHRVYPENSGPSVQTSLYPAVEGDLQLTSDNQWVMIHDDTINRTTNGSGTISLMTLSQIKEYNLKSDSGAVTGDKVPTLDEWMQTVKTNSLIPFLQIKVNKVNTEAMNNLVDTLKKYGYADSAVVTSFYTAPLRNVKTQLPDVKVMYITGSLTNNEITTAKSLGNNSGLDVILYKNGNTAAAIPTLNAQNINMAHQSGLSVGVWTLIPGQSWNYWTNRGTNVITIGSNLHGV